MQLPRRVLITEVGPRDGLQSEPNLIPTEQKMALIRSLIRAGVPTIELTALMNPPTFPQLADGELVVAALGTPEAGWKRAVSATSTAGVAQALDLGIDEIRLVVGATDAYNRHAQGESSAATLERYKAAVAMKGAGQRSRILGVISVAFGCPFSGAVPFEQVLSILRAYRACQVDGIVLADTNGIANPLQVARLLAHIRELWPEAELTLHFHNTHGTGLANVLSALQMGVNRFEAAVGGLGHCPFAPRAGGNLCTEDLVHMLHGMDIETGIDLHLLVEAAGLAERIIGRELPGLVHRAGTVSGPTTMGTTNEQAKREADGRWN